MNLKIKRIMILTFAIALVTLVSCKKKNSANEIESMNGLNDSEMSLDADASSENNEKSPAEDTHESDNEISLESFADKETEERYSEADHDNNMGKPSKGNRPNKGSGNTENDKEQEIEGEKESTKPGDEKPERETPPWEKGGKKPSEYTWKEYEQLSPAMQLEFQNTFKSFEEFEDWLRKALEAETKFPWESGGKQPTEYTWDEYEALTPAQQIAFQNSFASFEAFEEWMKRVLPEAESLPWKNGGKQPSEYTWAEYEALTPAQQMAFQNSFANVDAFNDWMQKAQGNQNFDEPERPSYPWENGGKLPSAYTWAEYEALTPDQQMAFQNWFASVDEFAAWMKHAQGTDDSDEEYLPWEHGGKQPDQYTWAEFEALTPSQQMAFQNWFASIDDFESWMRKAQGDSSAEDKMPWEEPGAKQPDQYTWAEFEALTPSQQMAFQNWFASIDAFDAWMQKAQGGGAVEDKMPWEEPGAKQPDQYTWAEFEALTPAQQMAFQNWFGSWENFDKWLQANQP